MVYMWSNCLFTHSHGSCTVIGYQIRNYLCNDMIRRVLRDYFGYNVQVAINLSQLCMNITDVDDKIINNSNEQNVPYF